MKNRALLSLTAIMTMLFLHLVPTLGFSQEDINDIDNRDRSLIQLPANQSSAPLKVTPSKIKSQRRDLADGFYQPRDRQPVILVNPGIQTQATESYYSGPWGSGNSRYDQTSVTTGLGIEYGLSEAVSLGLSTDYGTTETFAGYANLKEKGFSDLNLGAKANLDVSNSNKVILALSYSYSPERSVESTKQSYNGSSVYEGNRFSGGNSTTPKIGLQHVTDSGLMIGTTLGYTLYEPIKSVPAESDHESTTIQDGSTTLNAFIEKPLDKAILGGGLNHTWKGSSNTTSAVWGSNTSENYKYYNDALNLAGAAVYGAFFIGDGVTLRPSLNYTTIPDRYRSQNSKLLQADIVSAEITARIGL